MEQLTTIQLYEQTRKKLEQKKSYKRESYDTVIRRILERDTIPSMEEMFREGDKLKQEKEYSTEEVIALSHRLRGRK
ncbi:hypothetical protein HZA99_02820 [Candidatus Woesearchaeota archaeon]|nr:hypothetical protein [Candidatus Woesearchaeota archaeon]